MYLVNTENKPFYCVCDVLASTSSLFAALDPTDGTCILSDQEGEPIELNLAQDIVVKALRLQEGNHVMSNMKLTLGDRMLAFTMDNVNDSVYTLLHNDDICWCYRYISNIFISISLKSTLIQMRTPHSCSL